MALDLLLLGWLIIAGLLGFRDGSIRKLTSLLLTAVALFMGHLFMRDAGDVFIDMFDVSPSSGPMLGFLAVFLAIVLAQSIAYKIATDSYKIGGLADRVAGAFLGLFQGILFLSSLLFILSFVGVPSKSTKAYSKVYKSVVNVAPQMLDLFTTVQESSFEDIEQIAREKGIDDLKKMIDSGEEAADSVSNNRLLREVRRKSAETSRSIDSLRSSQRR